MSQEAPVKQRDYAKLSRIPVKIEPTTLSERPRLPKWLYQKLPKASEGSQISEIKRALRAKKLSSVCEEAACPNLPECFHQGTATFMIMGEVCTRRCAFCDVAHGKPAPLDPGEPQHLAETVKQMGLNYVVITSVDRDDLRDGGAQHFAECIQKTRALNPGIRVEILVPDFRGKNRFDRALDILTSTPPDVFNHNVETVPALYPQVRPGADYDWSLRLLAAFKDRNPTVLTKSGLMLGVGETDAQVLAVLSELRDHQVDMITIGQYLQPSRYHLPIQRYAPLASFQQLKAAADAMGFRHVASGPNVRSSYHADDQFFSAERP